MTSLLPESSTLDLQQRVERIYDHLYANAPVRTPGAIATEVGRVLHVAMFVEAGTQGAPAFALSRDEFRRVGSADSATIAALSSYVRTQFEKMNRAWKLYPPGTAIGLADYDIAYIVSLLSGVRVGDKDRDVFGDALEIFRSQWAKRAGGQFFTDQRITALAVELLEFDPIAGEDLVDICAGTGGFLLAGLNLIRRRLDASTTGTSTERKLVALATKALRGQEVDAEVCAAANATLAARISTVASLVHCGDSLLMLPPANSEFAIRSDSHYCAATNPPFGTQITVKNPEILRQYELARAEQGAQPQLFEMPRVVPRPPDILLLEQNLRLLRPGEGRLAIVLPYQLLSGPQTRYVREWLIRNAEILGVVDLPADTFQPHTGTKTALVVVRRRRIPLSSVSEAVDAPIFMALPRWIGHDRRGNPVFERDASGRLTSKVMSDIEQVGEEFRQFRKNGRTPSESTTTFSVGLAQIVNDKLLRLNAAFHHTKRELERDYGDPSAAVKLVPLGELVDRVFFPTRFKRNYVAEQPGAVPFLGGGNILQLVPRVEKWLHSSHPDLAELQVRAGWLLVTRSGTTGIVSSVPPQWDGYAMSEHVIRIVPNLKKVSAAYLHLALKTRYVQNQIRQGVFGSVIDEINPEHLLQLLIPIPRKRKQMEALAVQGEEFEHSRARALSAHTDLLEALDGMLTPPTRGPA